MGNLGEVKPISKIILTIDGVDYEVAGGGSGPLGPDTVGTEQIIDGAVEEQDLNNTVKDRMTITHDASTGGLRLGGYAQSGDVPADNAKDVGQGGGEDSDEDETGFETNADNGDEDI